MKEIADIHLLLRHIRQESGLTQSELADRIGTSQSAIANLESGGTNPTVDTLRRVAAANGYALTVTFEPLPVNDPVVDRYKMDVDRTLLRENRRRSVDERLRTLSEWQVVGDELQQATRRARQAAPPSRPAP